MDHKPYTYRESEPEARWVRRVVCSALPGTSKDKVFDEFERRMSEARHKCFVEPTPPVAAKEIQELRDQLRSEASSIGHRLVKEWFSKTQNVRARRRFLEDDLHQNLRDELYQLVRHHWLTIMELTSIVLYNHLQIFPYCVQVCGALNMLQGKAIEMLTGEGKTIVGPLVAIPMALRNQLASAVLDEIVSDRDFFRGFGLHSGELRPKKLGSLHMITSDSYLVLRDYTELKPVYSDFGIDTSYILDGMPNFERGLAYEANIIFGTANRFAWDYIESLSLAPGTESVLRPLPTAIVDEIDHGLIDEASTSFIVSSPHSSQAGLRLTVYQSYQFYRELSEDSARFAQFNLEDRSLDLTSLGVRMLRGAYRTAYNNIASWLKQEELREAIETFSDKFLASAARIDELTERGSIRILTDNSPVSYREETGRLEVNADDELIVRLAQTLVDRFSEQSLQILVLVAHIGELAARSSLAEAPRPNHFDLNTWLSDFEQARSLATVSFRRLLAAGLTRLVADVGSRHRLRQEVSNLRKALARARNVSSEDLEPPLVEPLVFLTRTLLIQPAYEVLIAPWVEPAEMERFLQVFGEIVDVVTRDAPAVFSLWIDEIPEEFLEVDESSEQLSLSVAGIQKLATFFSTFSFNGDHEAPQKEQWQERYRSIASLVIGSFEGSLKEAIASFEEDWDQWYSSALPTIEQEHQLILRKNFEKMTREVRELFRAIQQADLAGFDDTRIRNFMSHSLQLVDLMRATTPPEEEVGALEEMVISLLLVAGLQRLAVTSDSSSLQDLLGHLLRYFEHGKRGAAATLSLLLTGFVVSLVTGHPAVQIFGPGTPSGRLRGKFREETRAMDVFFSGLNRSSKLPMLNLTLPKAFELRAQIYYCFTEDPELIRRYLRIFALGQPIDSGSLVANPWLKQALYGYLDELRPLGLIDSYDASLAARVLEQCFHSEGVEEGTDYLFRQLPESSQSLELDPYTKQYERREIAIVDQATGRIAVSSRWSGQLHEVLEAKHNMLVRSNGSHRSVTMQALVRNVYESVIGMSGTLKEVSNELAELYEINIEVIPPNLPCARNDHVDLGFFRNGEAQEALVAIVAELAEQERPILIRCLTIEESDALHKILTERLQRDDIHLLNGRPENASHESAIIARAGDIGSIVVSTQIVGRGVDIRLQDPGKGLYVIGLERQVFRRWDRQFAGRSARQGDPGDSQFLCSLERSANHGSQRRFVGFPTLRKEKISDNVGSMQRYRELQARRARRQRSVLGRTIYRGNQVFEARRQQLTERHSRCNICRDHFIEFGQSAGVCPRCHHCLGKIRRTGAPCSDKFCISEDASVEFYIRGPMGDACAWCRVHEEFLDSDNPTLLPSEQADAIRSVHENLLTAVTDWPAFLATESTLQDTWLSRIDLFFLQSCCRALFDLELDRNKLEFMERQNSLPGSMPLRTRLERHLDHRLQDGLPEPDDCPWKLLLPPASHKEILNAANRGSAEPMSGLSGHQMQSYVSRRLYGAVAVARAASGDATWVADDLDRTRCVAADLLLRQIGTYFIDQSWDEWYRRVDEYENSFSKPVFSLAPGWEEEIESRLLDLAQRYIQLAQLRSVDAMLRLCRLAEIESSHHRQVEIVELLKPLSPALDVRVSNVARQIVCGVDPLSSFLKIAANIPEDQGLLLAIENTREPLRLQ